jgi:hypothetical protein
MQIVRRIISEGKLLILPQECYADQGHLGHVGSLPSNGFAG